MKYLCVFLAFVLFLVTWAYRTTAESLESARTELAVATAMNKANETAFAILERSMVNADKVLAGWNKDRTTLAGVRNATKQAIREAMRDETYKAWSTVRLPDAAVRLLHKTTDAHKNEDNGVGSSQRSVSGLFEDARGGNQDKR